MPRAADGGDQEAQNSKASRGCVDDFWGFRSHRPHDALPWKDLYTTLRKLAGRRKDSGKPRSARKYGRIFHRFLTKYHGLAGVVPRSCGSARLPPSRMTYSALPLVTKCLWGKAWVVAKKCELCFAAYDRRSAVAVNVSQHALRLMAPRVSSSFDEVLSHAFCLLWLWLNERLPLLNMVYSFVAIIIIGTL